ncbi:MAG: SPOR domain-containing protein [Desulfobacterales bacterium]|nr:SPOR domain-containing protein [Desulfobacterales bacterium]
MRDYKESAPREKKRSQLKRLFGIMGGMIFAFAIFIAGVKVGIQMERERVRIAEGVTAPMPTSKEKEGASSSEKERTTTPPKKKDDKMRFTFYETLTKKEGTGKETQKETTEKKGETKAPPPKTAKVEETQNTPAPKDLYFVQVASFKEEAAAEGLKGRLIKKGYAVQVVPVQIEKMGLWYRVRLGGYATLHEAQAAQKRITVEENVEGTKVVSGP